jgi:hypothetical protein
MTLPRTEQASAIVDPDDQSSAASFTGAEILTVKQSGTVLKTTLTPVAQWISQTYPGFTQRGTGAVARSIVNKIYDQQISVTDFGAVADGTPYSTSGGTDNTAAINNALAAASTLGFTTVVFPDAAGVYNVSGKIYLQPGVWIKGLGGRPKINLTASVDYVVDSNVNTQMYNIGWDNVDILCNSLANAGFYLRSFKNYYHNNCQIEDFNQQGFIIGDPTAVNPDSYIFRNLQTWRAHSNIPASTTGMWLRNAPDSLGYQCGFVGATVGMQIQSGGQFYDIHNWARASTGVMTTCFLALNGSCTFIDCTADTPTQVGFDLSGTGYVLDDCVIFNNNGTTATDNVITGVVFRTANPAATVTNLRSTGNDSSHRIAKDISTADSSFAGLTILGSTNINVVTPIGSASIPTSLQVGDQNQTATNLTITAADNTNRQLIFGWQTYPMVIMRVSGQNTGSNQGSNLTMSLRTDTGGALFQALSIVRSTNQWQIADSNTLLTTIHNVYGGGWALKTVGSGFRAAEGTNAKQGIVTLAGTTTVVNNTSVTANSRIFLTGQQDGGTPGSIRVSTRTAGTSFTITSTSSSDASVVAYEIFEPA